MLSFSGGVNMTDELKQPSRGKGTSRGLVLAYTGEGKGKSTAAFGLGLRAVGRGWKVLMIQYTKMGEWPVGEPMGEIAGARRLEPDFKVISTGIGFVNIFGDTFTFEEHRAAAQEGLELARQAMHSGEWDLIILDEILGAVSQKQIDLEQVLSLIAEKPHTLDICLTGHDAEKEFIDQILAVSDLATEMVKLKHPFDTGHQARKGIDY
jgi:cob(I)alamin adenosyltransferase